jgi:hypothetical protein
VNKRLEQALQLVKTYFEKTEAQRQQVHTKPCLGNSKIHKQTHSHLDLNQLEHFACLLLLSVIHIWIKEHERRKKIETTTTTTTTRAINISNSQN